MAQFLLSMGSMVTSRMDSPPAAPRVGNPAWLRSLLPRMRARVWGQWVEVSPPTKGQPLPWEHATVTEVEIDGLLEFLPLVHATRLLREIRRVLVPGGTLRANFVNGTGLTAQGSDPLVRRLASIEEALLEGRRWLRAPAEITLLLAQVGLDASIPPTAPDDPCLRVRATRPEVHVEQPGLVSVVIPAYKPQHFEACLRSVLGQTYRNLEVVVCDDDRTGTIAKVFAGVFDRRVRYRYNATRLGSRHNHLQCLAFAHGEFVKLLSDDDLLYARAVEDMVAVLRHRPDVSLVTSRRDLIDTNGEVQPETEVNRPPFGDDAVVDGMEAIGALMTRGNFIGEPSTTLFRRCELALMPGDPLSVGRMPSIANGDVALWVNLLSRGNLAYLTHTLSAFRQHSQQEQSHADFRVRGEHAWREHRRACAALGLWDPAWPTCLPYERLAPRALAQAMEQVNTALERDPAHAEAELAALHQQRPLLELLGGFEQQGALGMQRQATVQILPRDLPLRLCWTFAAPPPGAPVQVRAALDGVPAAELSLGSQTATLQVDVPASSRSARVELTWSEALAPFEEPSFDRLLTVTDMSFAPLPRARTAMKGRQCA